MGSPLPSDRIMWRHRGRPRTEARPPVTGTTVRDLTPSAPLQKCTDSHKRYRDWSEAVEDDIGGAGPAEGSGRLVVLGEIAVDRGLQLDDRAEHAALQPSAGEHRKEGLDRVQPGAGGRREMQGPARVAGEPGAHPGMFVGRI